MNYSAQKSGNYDWERVQQILKQREAAAKVTQKQTRTMSVAAPQQSDVQSYLSKITPTNNTVESVMADYDKWASTQDYLAKITPTQNTAESVMADYNSWLSGITAQEQAAKQTTAPTVQPTQEQRRAEGRKAEEERTAEIPVLQDNRVFNAQDAQKRQTEERMKNRVFNERDAQNRQAEQEETQKQNQVGDMIRRYAEANGVSLEESRAQYETAKGNQAIGKSEGFTAAHPNETATESAFIDKVLDPSYKMSKAEKKRAQKIYRDWQKETGGLQRNYESTEEEKRRMAALGTKSSNASTFALGMWKPFDNIGNMVGGAIGKIAGGDVQQAIEDQQSYIREARENAQTQNGAMYGAGNFAGNALLYTATNPIFDKIGEAAGLGKVGQFALNQLGQNAQDVVLDTLPELYENLNSGMSREDAAKAVGQNLAMNAAGNLAFAGIGAAAQKILPSLRGGADALADADNITKNIDADYLEGLRQNGERLASWADELDGGDGTRSIEQIVADQQKTVQNIEGMSQQLNELAGQAKDATKSVNQPPKNINAGRATHIETPYQGDMPISETAANRISLANDAINDARNNVANAGTDQSGALGRLRKMYRDVFDKRGGQRKVVLDNVSFGGDDYVVNVNNKSVDKVLSTGHLSPEKLAVLDDIDNVLKNSEFVGSGEYNPHHAGGANKNVIRYDYFETPITIDGKDYVATIDVEVYKDANNYRTHKVVDEINLHETGSAPETGLPSGVAVEPAPVATTATRTDIISDSKIPSSADAVNTPEPKFFDPFDTQSMIESAIPEATERLDGTSSQIRYLLSQYDLSGNEKLLKEAGEIEQGLQEYARAIEAGDADAATEAARVVNNARSRFDRAAKKSLDGYDGALGKKAIGTDIDSAAYTLRKNVSNVLSEEEFDLIYPQPDPERMYAHPAGTTWADFHAQQQATMRMVEAKRDAAAELLDAVSDRAINTPDAAGKFENFINAVNAVVTDDSPEAKQALQEAYAIMQDALNEPVPQEKLDNLLKMDLQFFADEAEETAGQAAKSTANVVETAKQFLDPADKALADPNIARTHTAEEIANMREYVNSTDQNIVDMAQRVRNGEKVKPYTVKQVDDRMAADLKAITGLDSKGRNIRIDNDSFKHIDKRHGINGTANQSMADDNSLGRIKYILDNYDEALLPNPSDAKTSKLSMSDTTDAPTAIFVKRIDGQYYVVTATSDSKKGNDLLVSAYIDSADSLEKQIEAGKLARMADAVDGNPSSPLLTSNTGPDAAAFSESSLSDSKISSIAEDVNSEIPALSTADDSEIPWFTPRDPGESAGNSIPTLDSIDANPTLNPKTRQSQAITNTARNSGVFSEQEYGDMIAPLADYVEQPEAETLAVAKNRLLSDHDGTIARYTDGKAKIKEFGASDVDAMMLALQEQKRLLANTTDEAAQKEIRSNIRKISLNLKKTGTENGRAVQAFAKWTRTADGAIATAETMQNSAVEKMLSTNIKFWDEIDNTAKEIKNRVEGIYKGNMTQRTRAEVVEAINAILNEHPKVAKKIDDAGVNQIADSILKGREIGDLQNQLEFLSTGFTELSDETIQRVEDLFDEMQGLNFNSKEYVQKEQEAFGLLANSISHGGSFKDKFDQWRYFSMLANPTTHIRNVVGNATFRGINGAKDTLAAGIEKAANAISGGKVGRTKSVLTAGDKDLIAACKADGLQNAYRELTGNKYTGAAQGIAGEMPTWNPNKKAGRVANAVTGFNTEALNENPNPPAMLGRIV